MTKAQLIAALDACPWKVAKTMPDKPHSYTLRHQWFPPSFDAAVEAIRRFGAKRKYQGRTYTYFDHAEYTYWTMGWPVNETILINRARTA